MGASETIKNHLKAKQDLCKCCWSVQVFDFIMDSLDKYRTLYRRMAQLMRDGVIAPPSNMRQEFAGYGHAHYGRQVGVSPPS